MRSVRRQLARVTVWLVAITLVLVLLTMSVYGSLVNYFGAEPLMYGSTLAGAALVGFAAGWLARPRR